MSETEAKTDAVVEQPTAEEIKGVKRAAEVRISASDGLEEPRISKKPSALSHPRQNEGFFRESTVKSCPKSSLGCRPNRKLLVRFEKAP